MDRASLKRLKRDMRGEWQPARLVFESDARTTVAGGRARLAAIQLCQAQRCPATLG